MKLLGLWGIAGLVAGLGLVFWLRVEPGAPATLVVVVTMSITAAVGRGLSRRARPRGGEE